MTTWKLYTTPKNNARNTIIVLYCFTKNKAGRFKGGKLLRLPVLTNFHKNESAAPNDIGGVLENVHGNIQTGPSTVKCCHRFLQDVFRERCETICRDIRGVADQKIDREDVRRDCIERRSVLQTTPAVHLKIADIFPGPSEGGGAGIDGKSS